MKKGISTIYDLLLENLVRRGIDINIKELKYIGDLVYRFIISHEEEVKVMIDEYKKTSIDSSK